MSGSEPKNENDTETPSDATEQTTSLAGFLVPPLRPRSSVPPRSEPEAEAMPSDDAPAESTKRDAAPVKAEERSSSIPVSSHEGPARSLIPVETTSEDSRADDDDGMDDLVPAPVWSMANLRRVAIAAAIAVGVGGAAWFARRGPTAVAARDVTAIEKGAAVNPPPGAPKTIEADELDEAVPAPADSAAVLPPPDPAKGLEYRRQARQLLEAGQIDQGVAFARRAIEANPADPECYVLLAAGLQDQGRWQESREVFSRCIRRSSTGINAECVYFATSGSTGK